MESLILTIVAILGVIILIIRIRSLSLLRSKKKYKKDLAHILRVALSRSKEKRTEVLKRRFKAKADGYENKFVRKNFPPEKLGNLSQYEIDELKENLPRMKTCL